MFYWIYEIPTLMGVVLFVAVFVGVSWLGIVLSRPFVKKWFHQEPGLKEILGDYLQYFGVIYGLLLGLLAVGTYQNFADVEKAVANEASALAALYRDVSAYPEPDRTDLKNRIREYTRSTIDDDWPLQRKGIAPDDGKVNRAAPIHERLVLFEPQTKAQQALHNATLTIRLSSIEGRVFPLLPPFASDHVVYGRCRGSGQHDPILSVRPPPWRAPARVAPSGAPRPWRHR
jgi:hypothetical protein